MAEASAAVSTASRSISTEKAAWSRISETGSASVRTARAEVTHRRIAGRGTLRGAPITHPCRAGGTWYSWRMPPSRSVCGRRCAGSVQDPRSVGVAGAGVPQLAGSGGAVPVPKTSSAQVGAVVDVVAMLWLQRAVWLVPLQRSASCGIMINCAAATGLPQRDERIRVTPAACSERRGQIRGDPGAAVTTFHG